jgi:diguanylate cyclase (GGDEF)-like protein
VLSKTRNKIAEWRSAFLQSTTFFGVATIGLICASVIFSLKASYENTERNAFQNSAKLARAFEENIVRSIKEADAALLFLRAAYEKSPETFAISDWVGGSNYRNDLTLQFSITDENGFVSQIAMFGPSGNVEFMHKGITPMTANVADREPFQFHINAKGDELFLSKPLVGATTGKVSVMMSRRIRHLDGSFAGAVATAIDPQYFARFYRSVDIGKDGSILVVGLDGFVRAQAGYKSDMVGKSIVDTRPFMRIREADSGHFMGTGGIDGIKRLVAYRHVEGLPLIVTISLSEAEVFADYRQQQYYYYFGAAGLTLVILIVVGLGILRGRRLGQARAVVDTQNRRFDVALNNMTHGLCMFDAKGKLVVYNARYIEMFGLPPGFIKPGISIKVIIDYFLNSGDFIGDGNKYTAEVSSALASGKSYQVEREMVDGRVIKVTNRPLPDGGWVATHEDITAQKTNERSLKTALSAAEQASIEVKSWNDKLDAAIGNMHHGLLMVDSDQKVVVVNEQYIHMYDLSPDIVKPGCDLLELFRHRAETGHLKMKPEEYRDTILARVAEGQTTTMTTHMADGRIISVVNRPMSGGSWVATHEDVTERRHWENKIAHMAHYDGLTDLPNRALFGQRLNAALERGDTLAVHYLDLDDFKGINDTLGHAVGDGLLKSVAARLLGCVGVSDTVARLGGDEFAIIQIVNTGEDAEDLARRIRDAIAKPCEIDGQRVKTDVSIGISLSPYDATEFEQILKNADMALYRAKSEGRGTHRFFEAAMDANVKVRRALEVDLRKALDNGELELYYQPIVNLARNAVSGCEALVRWRHPVRGMVSPAEFIPIAEETGLIVSIGEWVLRTACAEAAKWPSHIKVAVNVSPVQFKNQSLALRVANALGESGLSADRLEMEITEAVLVQDTFTTLTTLHQLRDLGVRIAMDDFGTGYSSLSYLRSFPFDKIKIDQSFIKDLASSNGSAAIVSAVTGLASNLNMTTTAEGVETPEQLELIHELGCTEMQGYLFSRPKPAAELSEILGQTIQAKFAPAAIRAVG